MMRPQAADRYRSQNSARRIVIISRDNTRSYTFSPLALFGGLTLFLTVSLGFLAATTYLVFRDDLFDLVRERNADMQQAYEDRIARLRSEIDRISSRQILDSVAMDEKVEKIMTAQQGIADRQRAVGDLIDKARSIGLLDDNNAAVPADRRAALDPADVTGSVNAYADAGRASLIDRQFDALTSAAPNAAIPKADLRTADGKPDFRAISSHLAAVDAEQAKAVEAIAVAANSRVDAAVDIIANAGLRVNVPEGPVEKEDAVGGPFIPVAGAQALAAAMQEADQAFGRMALVKAAAARLPLVRPLPGGDMTSNYGSRRDPFLGSLAFHAGIDFRSPTGTDIRPTAPGVVTAAGWAGGYGNMVEVDHGNGVTTRYGHMSRIVARVGDRVTRDTIIGEVGSTGRSTGPHLHYETRVNGAPFNPINYINAGNRLASLLP
ncbi:peptidase [Pleomorphomonas diazotrophica]|uniref:Peptidase n=1 Tax=Pleomorphomonas diazotrophica TaxID=1166257 RepID=A0A1I4Q3F1_9HYPH|nr:peptidoglycan DD-metalloendopeptidase family protein [Pleomorphomonas diazotrophica]PKR90966.1 peptidase [Pleomorphomonas diazotrophica]SFM34564.1 Murein DD-endopeptidase MepM and murein hydrolase activator NlpD, contain LysM domain [Pleomorphomonas diazotrophica]